MKISKKQAVMVVCESVSRLVLAGNQPPIELSADTALLGQTAVLNSMQLVELCLALEDKALELGFEFDWTSDAAMSRANSMFRSVDTLASEFFQQSQAGLP